MKQINYILIFILLLTTVVAPSPFTQVSTEGSVLNIIYPKNLEFPQNAKIDLHFHVFNSTGQALFNDTVNFCTFHLYNQTGNHLLKQNLTFSNEEWEIELSNTYTSTVGAYPYIVWCEEPDEKGFVSSEYFVSVNGVTYEGRGQANIALIFLMIFVLVAYLVMAISWDFTLFEAKKENKNNAAKGLLIWLVIWLIPALIQFGLEIAEGFGATTDMIFLMNVFYQVSIWTGITISIYFGIFFVYNVALFLAAKGGEMKK